MNFTKENALQVAAIFICMLFLVLIFIKRDFLIFRDFSIIWNGALYIANGYNPVNDFIMPVSPISIYISGFFLKVFGSNWLIFQITQLFINLLLLITIFFLTQKYSINKNLIKINLLVYTFLYLIFLTHPWYNNFAALFFLICIVLVNIKNAFSIAIAGTITAFTFFTKQDFGLLTFASCIAILINIYWHKDSRKNFNPLLVFFLSFAASTSLLMSLLIRWDDKTSIEIYNEIFINRVVRLFMIPELKNVLMLILGSWCVYISFKNSQIFFSYGLIIFVACLTSILGGMAHTHFYYLFTIPPIIHFCFQNLEYKNHLFILMPIIIFLIFPPAKLSIHIIENIVTGAYESEFFNKRNISTDIEIINLSSCSKQLENIHGPKDFCEILKIVKENLLKTQSIQGNVLNITEINFIGALLGIPPNKGHPLWYKNDQTLGKSFQTKLEDELLNGKYRIVLIQNVKKDYSSAKYRNKIIKLMQKNSIYHQHNEIFKSPMCIQSNLDIQECGISIFVKRANVDL